MRRPAVLADVEAIGYGLRARGMMLRSLQIHWQPVVPSTHHDAADWPTSHAQSLNLHGPTADPVRLLFLGHGLSPVSKFWGGDLRFSLRHCRRQCRCLSHDFSSSRAQNASCECWESGGRDAKGDDRDATIPKAKILATGRPIGAEVSFPTPARRFLH